MYRQGMPLGKAYLSIIAAEHDKTGRDIFNPENDMQIIFEQISRHDIIVPEYVPLELQEKALTFPALGKRQDQGWAQVHVNPFFQPIVDAALESGKPIYAVDPANTAITGIYQTIEHVGTALARAPINVPVNFINTATGLGLPMIPYTYEDMRSGMQPFTWLEKILPTTIDARRLIYAKGLMQIARMHPGAQILTITPPAHAKRIEWYLRNQKDPRTVPGRFGSLLVLCDGKCNVPKLCSRCEPI